mmetsp:Transcript_74571/g.118700  ORF Transcript_74571/g.118700 Transcript_74571/m.118700 type:complete len:275 (-) Transcript_74571:168-992(-)
MSNFRRGGRNIQQYVRPMVELQSSTGFDTSRKLMRWGARNSLMNDFHVKRPKRHARWKYHEHQWLQRKRWIREYWTRRWKREVRNTADMALWWKFRVNAKQHFDKEQYENYLQQREDARMKQLLRSQSYVAWSLSDCIEQRDYIKYTKTSSEEEYLLSIKPETFLQKMRERFLEKNEHKVKGYSQWKNKYDAHVVMKRTMLKKANSNQLIKASGVEHAHSVYDWIQFNEHSKGRGKHSTALMMMSDDDPQYLQTVQMIEQNAADQQLLKDIANE